MDGVNELSDKAVATDRSRPGYYYEHINGVVKWKPEFVVDMGGGPEVYFDSPFSKRWWKVGADGRQEEAGENGEN